MSPRENHCGRPECNGTLAVRTDLNPPFVDCDCLCIACLDFFVRHRYGPNMSDRTVMERGGDCLTSRLALYAARPFVVRQ